MKLYEKLADRVKVGKKTVKLDLDFRNVLKMIEILQDESLYPDAREWLAMRCVCKHPVKGMFTPVYNMLFPKVEKHERLTDFEQDAELIVAAFRQAYGINLFKDKLHWTEFCALLGCIPDGSRYTDIIGIRARPMPRETNYNSEERAWLLKAKAEYALKTTKEEDEQAYRQGVRQLSAFLMSIAGEGDK